MPSDTLTIYAVLARRLGPDAAATGLAGLIEEAGPGRLYVCSRQTLARAAARRMILEGIGRREIAARTGLKRSAIGALASGAGR